MEDMLKDKNYAPKQIGKTCVLGLGKTGYEVAVYLLDILGKRVESLHIYAGKKNEFAMQAADKLLDKGATVSFDDTQLSSSYDLCIASPGISCLSAIYQSALNNCNEVISEIEFAWRESAKSAKWVAITGTNGKTTTTSLLDFILKDNQKHVSCVGNIGNVAISAVAKDKQRSIYQKTDIYVVEVSSYQLYSCKKFSPYISVLLNITPDHISWHGSFEDYRDAKLKVFNNARVGIINIDDKISAESVDKIYKNNKDIILVKNSKSDDIEVNEQRVLAVKNGNKNPQIVNVKDLRIFGEHNYTNARAAVTACLCLGLTESQIAKSIVNFKSLPHRMESCGIIAGVRLYNDSKATNVDATLVAMDSFEPKKAIFLLGGHDKNTNLHDLVKKANERLKGVVCYGAAQDRFYRAFIKYQQSENDANSKFFIKTATDLKSAFKIAMENTFPGDFVVLSPACASYDQYNSFEERGNDFKKIVEKCK